jgi:hypothetical protein
MMTNDLGTPDRPKNVLEAKFWAFHEANPQVYLLFNKFATEAARANRGTFGVSAIFERMRWFTTIETRGEEFKLNNNYAAYYGRLWMRNNPEYEGFFATRTLLAKKITGEETEND